MYTPELFLFTFGITSVLLLSYKLNIVFLSIIDQDMLFICGEPFTLHVNLSSLSSVIVRVDPSRITTLGETKNILYVSNMSADMQK